MRSLLLFKKPLGRIVFFLCEDIWAILSVDKTVGYITLDKKMFNC